MFGFLLQWPTLPTLVMFPVLVLVFISCRLTSKEERYSSDAFGDAYRHYRDRRPAFT
ncbi:Isoprenylcysteine carboxyl methyltransferase (fragment) [Denitratisoma oestradiolicum]|uniref:Isoprenylcysteine carboxyl methyltransferase n=1 Tax=Denitratisoma oestradiolicum TaxID=311182 RepID=A0A6S6Y137_9PROT